MSTNRITVGAFHEDPGEQITMSWRDKENLKNWRKREYFMLHAKLDGEDNQSDNS